MVNTKVMAILTKVVIFLGSSQELAATYVLAAWIESRIESTTLEPTKSKSLQ